MDPKKAEKKIALKHNTMKLFKLNEDNEMYTIDISNNTRFFLAIDYIKCGMLNRDNEMYTVDIPNNTCFFLAIDYVGCGMSFR